MRKIAAVVFALLLSGCGEDSAKRAIEAQGFKQVRLVPGIVWWGCGESDDVMWNQKFAAVGANGASITGVACGGLMKGWTVRLD